jgi:hypothetical protein
MGIVPKAVHELLDVLVDERVMDDIVRPLIELLFGREVMALRHEAVLANPGSYAINPKSSSLTLICRKSIARMVPSAMGTS